MVPAASMPALRRASHPVADGVINPRVGMRGMRMRTIRPEKASFAETRNFAILPELQDKDSAACTARVS